MDVAAAGLVESRVTVDVASLTSSSASPLPALMDSMPGRAAAILRNSACSDKKMNWHGGSSSMTSNRSLTQSCLDRHQAMGLIPAQASYNLGNDLQAVRRDRSVLVDVCKQHEIPGILHRCRGWSGVLNVHQ